MMGHGFLNERFGGGLKFCFEFGDCGGVGRRHNALATPLDQRDGSTQQVAQAIGQVAVDAADKRLVRKISVLRKGDFA